MPIFVVYAAYVAAVLFMFEKKYYHCMFMLNTYEDCSYAAICKKYTKLAKNIL